MLRRLILLSLVMVFLIPAWSGRGQSPRMENWGMPDSCRPLLAPDNNLWQRMLWGEETLWLPQLAERPREAGQHWLSDGLGDRDPAVRAFSARALGRLERPGLVGALAPMLSDPSPEVRSEAATAIGQAAQGAAAGLRGEAMRAAADLLRRRLAEETDAAIRGAICETLGRLTYADAADLQAIEKLLVDATYESAFAGAGEPRDAPVAARLGAVKGLESLLRQHAKLFRPSDRAVARLRELALARREAGEDVRRVRRLALLALAPHQAADEGMLAAALEDDQWEVRRIAVRTAGAGLRVTTGPAGDARLAVIRRGLEDRDWHVRYEAVSAWARNQDAPGCDPLLRAAADRNPHVALLAVGQLSRCQASAAVPLVSRLVRTLPAPEKAGGRSGNPQPSWHRAAHAVVALARLAPVRAQAELERFRTSGIWQVRMYAARAAAVLKNGGILRTLADDPNDNVRNAAVIGLAETEQHAADHVYLAQLARQDGQLLMTAARALRGSKDPAAVPALLEALAAQTRLGRDTTRDPRLALLERIGELGLRSNAAALEPLLRDFDARIAASAAAILTRWMGSEHTTAVPPRTEALASLALQEVRRLEGAVAVVHMKSGGTFTLALLTWQAPATVAGFARLVECGYYNGLTFHRIEPNFVIQGGSPGANEYSGYGRFMRDEVGPASNLRASVGLSTRGRNTGDAQWYINLADNARLDHNYTVFANVVSGMDVVDAILEGDQIAEITIVEAKKVR